MATAPAVLSIHDYLQTSYKPDVNFLNGQIEERNGGEYDHGKLQGMLFHVFTLNAKAWGTDPVIEQRVRVRPDGYAFVTSLFCGLRLHGSRSR